MRRFWVTLATAAALPSPSAAFASPTARVSSFFLRQAPQHHRQSPLDTPYVGHILAFSWNGRRGGGGKTGVEAVSRSAVPKRTGKIPGVVMGLEVVPVLGGLEAAAAAVAGHVPGVLVGVATVVWTTVLKAPGSESPLKPVSGVIGSFLTFLTVTMLAVRMFTFGADTRYIDSFPTAIAHPEGCTRIAAEGGNKKIAVPTFTASVEQVQTLAKDWLQSQPRTTIETDVPGYLHAKSLSLLFGFPDSIGVKVFKNSSGKTEVWVQSELRVGRKDLGVNLARIKALLGHLGMKLS